MTVSVRVSGLGSKVCFSVVGEIRVWVEGTGMNSASYASGLQLFQLSS